MRFNQNKTKIVNYPFPLLYSRWFNQVEFDTVLQVPLKIPNLCQNVGLQYKVIKHLIANFLYCMYKPVAVCEEGRKHNAWQFDEGG